MEKHGKSELDFNELIKPGGSAKEHELSGPFFGKLKIIVDKGRSDNTTLVAGTYPGMPLKNGINFFGGKVDYTKSDHKKEKVTFTFK